MTTNKSKDLVVFLVVAGLSMACLLILSLTPLGEALDRSNQDEICKQMGYPNGTVNPNGQTVCIPNDLALAAGAPMLVGLICYRNTLNFSIGACHAGAYPDGEWIQTPLGSCDPGWPYLCPPSR